MSNIYPATPDYNSINGNLLQHPTEGQHWYNSTNKHMYVWRGTEWVPLMNRNDYAANWGQLMHGEYLPNPENEDGYIFEYDECIWATSPAALGKFDSFTCYADASGLITMQYRPLGTDGYVEGIANYIIIGIRGNVNNGVIVAPDITPTPTPSPGASLTPTPTPTPSATTGLTPTPTPTPTPSTSSIPELIVSITDPETESDASILHSYCNIANYNSFNRDNGYASCDSKTLTICGPTSCAPEPGDDSIGPVFQISVSGGVPPYYVSLYDFQYDNRSNLLNPSFEDGNVNWTLGSGWNINDTSLTITGDYAAEFTGSTDSVILSEKAEIEPDRIITAFCNVFFNTIASPANANMVLYFYNNSDIISIVSGNNLNSAANTWIPASITAQAPNNATHVAVGVNATKGIAQASIYVDDFSWNIGNYGDFECFYIGGAVVNTIPYSATVKVYTISTSGGYTPIISINGICSENIFSMAGVFSIEVTDSFGQTVTQTKKWSIYRINNLAIS